MGLKQEDGDWMRKNPLPDEWEEMLRHFTGGEREATEELRGNFRRSLLNLIQSERFPRPPRYKRILPSI
ncbi:hypothetical protein A3D00_01620 [Candidatus Woesebacteria bacterium RIFCSPHIGHO2_02_FULL_38_9]|uniref:Uncharacterized protein n=1 Tax=Candidatus Woesebacteria bacterium RIFCSPHIGHO2_01_FULL_39_28 TaxID=1802496 RepID=A0A1F7YKR2_9BACT|nr:MAG: hypothetical protein A2627_01995 [Candidatus Woesebacteria bacterium RIFCSPHIGHO2_01_FULL_39_28]OGM34086.1 MAG: hypothetical protein A3D00_01620 [Candidatus Woesebacteria bacterium RIFCSPHIGHO2_02_FULL_38_9]OGM56775.1 MAG: hypothetical protein A3A50_04190 [Candidatus Woesebacteria bacterium RIFCSPLOWO2_01_FULL_38_20]